MAVPENPKLLLASGPLFATQPSLRKTKSMANTGDQPLSSRRPALKMSVSPEQESEFRLAIQQSRKRYVCAVVETNDGRADSTE